MAISYKSSFVLHTSYNPEKIQGELKLSLVRPRHCQRRNAILVYRLQVTETFAVHDYTSISVA
jgi:hypothetical protein